MKFMQPMIFKISNTKNTQIKNISNAPCNLMYTNKRQIIGLKPPSISNYQPDLESIDDKAAIHGSSILNYTDFPRYIQ